MARNKKEEEDKAAKAKAEAERAAREAKEMEEGLREYRQLCGKDYVEGEDDEDEDNEEQEEGAIDVDKEFLHLIGPVNDAFERSVQELQGSCVNAVKTCMLAKEKVRLYEEREGRELTAEEVGEANLAKYRRMKI